MFERDEDKNRKNLEKHGIAFEDVLPVFASRAALTLEDRRRDYGEARHIILCPLKDGLVACDVHGARRERQADLGPARQQTGEAGS
ncbi:MAG: BrnT family toxin [Geminicoccaceae bacterium]